MLCACLVLNCRLIICFLEYVKFKSHYIVFWFYSISLVRAYGIDDDHKENARPDSAMKDHHIPRWTSRIASRPTYAFIQIQCSRKMNSKTESVMCEKIIHSNQHSHKQTIYSKTSLNKTIYKPDCPVQIRILSVPKWPYLYKTKALL